MPLAESAGLTWLTLDVWGWQRRCLVYRPESAPAQDRPLMLFLHGAGATVDWALEETGWAEWAEHAGFLLALPEALPLDPNRPPRFLSNPPVWSDGADRPYDFRPPDPDLHFLDTLLRVFAEQFNADPRRVYVSGFSNGAAMTFRYAAERSDRLTAIAPVAGHCWLSDPQPSRSIPTLYLVGTDDPLVPLAGGQVLTPWRRLENKPPVAQTLERWAAALGVASEARTEHETAETRVLEFGSKLRAGFIAGLGHHWPGGKGQMARRVAGVASDRVCATAVIWDFCRDLRG